MFVFVFALPFQSSWIFKRWPQYLNLVLQNSKSEAFSCVFLRACRACLSCFSFWDKKLKLWAKGTHSLEHTFRCLDIDYIYIDCTHIPLWDRYGTIPIRTEFPEVHIAINHILYPNLMEISLWSDVSKIQVKDCS